MKVTFPHLGSMYIFCKAIAETAGIPYVLPRPTSNHTREIGDKLTDIAHDHHDLVISTMHVHLTHSSCLEVMGVKGTGEQIRHFADKMISTRGVKHGKLVITGLVEDATE